MISSDSVVLVTGGTGSFGNTFVRHLLDTKVGEIRVLSRDEKKQDDMRKSFNDERLKLYLGDVRDYHSILTAINGTDYIFHAAALKQVPSCEFFPLEALKTNVTGTENVLEAAILFGVKSVVCLSTDKAVYPINAMGMSKALMEKVAIAKSRNTNATKICITRYGNVLSSRGSVVPIFVEQVENGKSITVTDPAMTRFVMTLDQAVSLVNYAMKQGQPGDIFVQKSPAADIGTLQSAVKEVLGRPDVPTKIIGHRHGEKLFESLLSTEEMSVAEDLGNYFRVPADQRDLNYGKYFDQGQAAWQATDGYNSHNSQRLTLDEVIDKLRTVDLKSGTSL